MLHPTALCFEHAIYVTVDPGYGIRHRDASKGKLGVVQNQNYPACRGRMFEKAISFGSLLERYIRRAMDFLKP